MARDIVALMGALGWERFFFAGHDRGARVAYRLALDAPQRVAAVATLDIIPTLETWETMDYRRAYGAYHWQFLAQPAPLPERLIGSDPAWYCAGNRRLVEDRGAADEGRSTAYCTAFARPGAVHAACEIIARATPATGSRSRRSRRRTAHRDAAVGPVGRRRVRSALCALPRGVGTLGARSHHATTALRALLNGRTSWRNGGRRCARSSTRAATSYATTRREATSPCAGRGARNRCFRKTAAPARACRRW